MHPMSLVGNLEDLGLGDILQIVSLSGKSGVLSLTSAARSGAIYFDAGLVVGAASTQFNATLGETLIKHKLLAPSALDALSLAQQQQPALRQADFFTTRYKLPPETLEAIIKAFIQRIVYSFFAWTEGSFSFALEEGEQVVPRQVPVSGFYLKTGLNSQWLAAEGRRLASEGRLLSDAAVVPPFAPSAAQTSTQGKPDPGLRGTAGPLFIIDDDGPTRAVLERAFVRAGFEVESFALPAELINACSQRLNLGQRPALLVDLIMPRLDGHGILGGLEVVEIVSENLAGLPVLLMTDHPNAEAEKKAHELGCVAVLRKPKKVEIRQERGIEVLKNLLVEVEHCLSDKGLSLAPALQGGFRLEAALADDIEDPFAPSAPVQEESPGLYLLKGMLQELADPLLGGGVILLTLRFASEMLNRAVIFNVHDHEIVGVGQFGLDQVTENADRLVRKLRLNIAAGSLFDQVVRHKKALKGTLTQASPDCKLLQHFGGVKPLEVFVGPLISNGKVVAIIYADNLPDQRPVGNVEAFEVFLSQAGMAMERVLLERRSA